jgi:hypothetical protein
MARGPLILAVALAILYSFAVALAISYRWDQLTYKWDQMSEARLPSYHAIQREPSIYSDCPEGFVAKCLEVVTEATSDEDFALLTEHFHDENPEYTTVLVFYRNPQSEDVVAQGVWVADEVAARLVFELIHDDIYGEIGPASAYSSASAESVRDSMVNHWVDEAMENDHIFVRVDADAAR